MRYFTPDLILHLNSSDGETVDRAMEQWDKAILSYKKDLQKILRQMPSQSRSITELSLHDWNLLDIVNHPDACGVGDTAISASIAVRHNKNLVIVWYSLSQELQRIDPPKEWSLSAERVHWLYDEVDADGTNEESFIHRILFSDGTTLLVPFSNCRAVQVNADHAMSHSDLMQIAKSA